MRYTKHFHVLFGALQTTQQPQTSYVWKFTKPSLWTGELAFSYLAMTVALIWFHLRATAIVSVTSPATPTLPDDLYLLLVGCAIIADEPNLALLGASRLATMGATSTTTDGILDGPA